jgi:ribosomal-protein-alanine N-acetyltransferase
MWPNVPPKVWPKTPDRHDRQASVWTSGMIHPTVRRRNSRRFFACADIPFDMQSLQTRFVDRPMTEADIPAVMAMESAACLHPMHAWSEENYRSSMRAGYWLRVRCASDTGHVVAVCVAMNGVDEIHLLNIAVDKAFHGQGVASEVLALLYERCREQYAAHLWLEVRPSNLPARALYVREGFTEIGLRKSYYPAPDGREDALVMRRDIAGASRHGPLYALD